MTKIGLPSTEDRIFEAAKRALLDVTDKTYFEVLDEMVNLIEQLRIKILSLEGQLEDIWGD